MQYRRMRGVDAPLSVLGFGAMRLPKAPDGRIDRPTATAMVRYAIDHGVNYVDTAYVYHEGESEPFLGEALGDGYRERVHLATKLPVCMVKERGEMDRILDEQLTRLRTDVIDFYLLHGLSSESWERAQALGVLEFLDEALADGRIRHAGFSFHDDFAAFTPIVDAYDWTFCQIQYNYMDIHYQGGAEAVRYAADRRLGVVVMEPLRGGALARPIPGVAGLWAWAGADRTPAEWALRLDLGPARGHGRALGDERDGPGPENVAYADRARPGSLSPAERAVYDNVRELYRGRTAIDCTRCGYCQPCPSGVDIPECFGLYNDAHVYGDAAAAKSGTTSSPGSAGPRRTAPSAASARSAARRGSRSGSHLKAVTELLG